MYIIEGNVGAGKSTFADILRDSLYGTHVVTEPVQQWHSPQAHESLFGHFISEPTRWAFTMETFAMMSRVNDHVHYQQYNKPVVMERSVYSGHYCFACNGFRQGFMTLKEWEIYMQYFDYLIPRYCKPPKGFIYLDVTPEIAYERVQKRCREQEEGIPLSYLQQLDEMHKQFLTRKENILPDIEHVPVLQLSVDQEFADDPQKQNELIENVRDFMFYHG